MYPRAKSASDMMRALGNENRLMILCILSQGEKSVGELVDMIGLGQSPLSQHLSRLRQEGLVQSRRQSNSIFYSLADENSVKVIELLYSLYCDKPPA